MNLTNNPNVPVLPGYVNLTEAAGRLGISRSNSYAWAARGKFATLHRVGSQPMYVVSTEEIDEMIAAREARDSPSQ